MITATPYNQRRMRRRIRTILYVVSGGLAGYALAKVLTYYVVIYF